jgi:hypothetical protein
MSQRRNFVIVAPPHPLYDGFPPKVHFEARGGPPPF